MQEKIIILDFGSQTTQLIGRRVRELDTYCEIVPYNKFPKEDPTIKGVILSGSPFSVYDKDAFKVDLSEIRGKYPILGICYGAQYLSYTNGGKVNRPERVSMGVLIWLLSAKIMYCLKECVMVAGMDESWRYDYCYS